MDNQQKSFIDNFNGWAKRNPVLFIIIAIVFISGSIKIGSSIGKGMKNDRTNNRSVQSKSGQACNGNEGCIDKVRTNFTNTGKQILGEKYLENGLFGISFLDASKGETYNAEVSTDCNCNIVNVHVSIMK